MFKLRFTRRILLFVCIPMLVQIALVGVLAYQIRQLERCYTGEAQAADFLTDNVKFLSQLLSCAGVQALYQVTKEPKFLRSYQNGVKATTLQAEKLQRQAHKLSFEQKDNKELEELFLTLKKAADRGQEAVESQDQVDQNIAYYELRGVLNKVNGVNTKFMGRLTDERRATAARRLAAQGQIYGIIVITIAANILVLLIFIFRFDRLTSQRFSDLTENVMSLGANQKLSKNVTGSDDLAELDSVIHRVSRVMSDARLKEQAIVEQAVDVICALDENGRFQQINPAAERLWKYEHDELLGKSLLSMVLPDEKERVHRTLKQLVADEGMATFETNVLARDEQQVEMQWNAFFSQEMKLIFCVAHDVTERKKIERLKAKLVEMISHDLRSPMSAMQITLNILSSGSLGELPEPVTSRINRAELSLAQMVDMLDDFLELEKLDSAVIELDYQQTEATEIIRLARGLIEELASKKKLTIETQSDEVSLRADKPRLVRVLTNLLSNAIKFSPANSTITIVGRKENEDVVFEVTDQGPGIDKGDQATIFERFTQTSAGKQQSKGGIGLGLSVCKAIVDAHGGTIRLESEKGQGCKFIVSLPCGTMEA